MIFAHSLRVVGAALVLAGVAVSSAGCAVGLTGADYPPGDYPPGSYPVGAYDNYPPDAYIATTEPVYFDGHASYWYGDHWYYRDGGRWNHYDREPPGLYQRRVAAPAVRRSYEPYRGHAVAHPSVRGGGGHGHR